MGKSVKIAISLPDEVAKKVENIRKKTLETRSAFIKRAIETMLKGISERSKIEKYMDGYLERPETTGEIKASEAAAVELLSKEPWE